MVFSMERALTRRWCQRQGRCHAAARAAARSPFVVVVVVAVIVVVVVVIFVVLVGACVVAFVGEIRVF